MTVTEVTFKQWDIWVAMGGCDFLPGDLGWGRGQIPLVNVSWEQMNRQFIPWLNANSEGGYHLPSEAQWKYIARDGKIGKQRLWGMRLPVVIKLSRVGNYAPTDWGLL